MQNSEYKNRLSQARKLLLVQIKQQNLNAGAIIVSSASVRQMSRDQDYPYRQSSNLLYFLGSEKLDGAILLICSNQPKPILFAKSRSKEQLVWDGPGINIKNLAESLNLEFIDSNNTESEVLKKLKGIDLLFYNNEINSSGLNIASRIMEMPVHQRMPFPKRLFNLEIITEQLRLYKSSAEVIAIEEANAVANSSLLCALPFITAGKKESAVAATIEYAMKLQDAETSFSTIVATGKNAAVLHHRASESLLKKSQLLLIDWGARLNGYCSDITRCLTIGTTFNPQQKDIYEIVLSAQLAAIRKVKHGVLVKAVYDAALKELATGLKELGLIQAPVSQIIDKKLYQPFFPHGIGHTLGMDTHDIGQMRSDQNTSLAKGMVITIEPGLYFTKSVGKIQACGVRIEDNLLVEQNSAKILSAGFPKTVREIESLVG